MGVGVRGDRRERSKNRDESTERYDGEEGEEDEGVSRGSCASLPRHCRELEGGRSAKLR